MAKFNIIRAFKPYIQQLKLLTKATSKQRVQLLRDEFLIDDKLILLIVNIAVGVLRGEIKIKKSIVKKLLPHKKILRQLGGALLVKHKKPSAYYFRRKLTSKPQIGGFLPFLIAPIVAALAATASTVVDVATR